MMPSPVRASRGAWHLCTEGPRMHCYLRSKSRWSGHEPLLLQKPALFPVSPDAVRFAGRCQDPLTPPGPIRRRCGERQASGLSIPATVSSAAVESRSLTTMFSPFFASLSAMACLCAPAPVTRRREGQQASGLLPFQDLGLMRILDPARSEHEEPGDDHRDGACEECRHRHVRPAPENGQEGDPRWHLSSHRVDEGRTRASLRGEKTLPCRTAAPRRDR